jgi:hypothetical protein
LGVFFSVTELQFSGYIFLEFSNHQNAAEAVAATNNLKLDKQHTFTVNLFSGTIAYVFLYFCFVSVFGPYVFGPPGSASGSVIHWYGSGSVHHEAKN